MPAQMTRFQRLQKRIFDFVLALIGILILGWFILLIALIAYFDTGKNGFFIQNRVGKNGFLFKIIKIRSIKSEREMPHITRLGKFWRKTKIDELPQLWNVLKGEMSFVGPRPDIEGFADVLKGEDRLLLSVRPGITGPSTLKFRNEEALLAFQLNPEQYNCEVIWPEKVRLNLEYIRNYSFKKDIELILTTSIEPFQTWSDK